MNKLFIGDNLEIMRTLPDNSVDAAYTDPPYLTKNHKLTYFDNWTEEDWIVFMKDRLVELKRVMKPSATMLMHIDQNMMVELHNLIYQVFGKKNVITTFIWKKKSSSSAQSSFATVEHEYIIAVAKNIKKAKWNGIAQFEPKDRQHIFDDISDVNILPHNLKTQSYPLYHGADPREIKPDQKQQKWLDHEYENKDDQDNFRLETMRQKGKAGADLAVNRPKQSYPIYVEDDGSKLSQRFDKVSKGERNPQTRPKETYPLYHGADPGDTDKPLVVQQGAIKKSGKNQNYPLYHGADPGDRIETLAIHTKVTSDLSGPNQSYPIYVSENDTDKLFVEQGCNNTGAPEHRKYPLYHGADPKDIITEYKKTGIKSQENNRKNQQYPLNINKTKISLTPFPGSVEVFPMNGKQLGCWRAIPATCQKLIDADMLIVKNNKKTGQSKIYQKQYANYQFNKKTGKLEPFVRTTPIRTILMGDKYPTNLTSNKEIKEIFGSSKFTYAKPLPLVKNLLKIISNEGDVVLDIFAGSGTTGQAAFELKRQFILVQLDEGGIPDLIKTRLDMKVGSENYEIKTMFDCMGKI